MGQRPRWPTTGLAAVALVVAGLVGCTGSSGSEGADGSGEAGGEVTTTSVPDGAAVASSSTSTSTTTTGPPIDCTPPAAGLQQVTVAGEARSFTVAVPGSFAGPAPVLVAFHGFASSAEEFAGVTGLAEQGPAAGVVVVLPQALGSPTGWRIVADFEQDRAFADAMLEQVLASDCVDPDRVWLGGFSAGSGFAGVYGCGRADADPGSVAGLLLVSGLPPAICPEQGAPRVAVVHGTADPVVRFQGGEQVVDGEPVPLVGVPESVAGWAARSGCADGPAETGHADDLTLSSWSSCDGGPVDLLAIADGGHAWPGGAAQSATGRVTQSVSASCLFVALALDAALDLGAQIDACPGDHPDLTGG